MSRHHLPLALALLLLAPPTRGAGIQPLKDQAEARLDRSALPATGRQEATVLVKGFGRYSITVQSPQGTALQLVDPMAGPGAVSGAPGESDGRLDLFLDRGHYRLLALSDERGSGDARLDVHAFRERNGAHPPRLIELRSVDEQLGDFEQISYWLHLDAAQSVAIEAAGRHLSDLRLWKDGTWLVGSEPQTELVEPSPGRPMLACRLTVGLEPGLYLLTAYGGPGQPWASGGDEQPLHLRWGIPRLGEAGRRRREIGPMGMDRWLLPAAASYVRLELPEARKAWLQVAAHDESAPFTDEGEWASIEKDSSPPVAEIHGDTRSAHVVTVHGEPGQPYVLQHFELRDEYPLPGPGTFWVSSLHSGHPGDSIDTTALVVRRPAKSKPSDPFELAAAQTVQLGPESVWARRFNLLAETQLFIRVREPGGYGVLAEGASARFRVEPFFDTPPPRYRPPAPVSSGAAWDLDAGTYVLTLLPDERGVLSLALHGAEAAEAARSALAAPEGLSRGVVAEALFPELRVGPDRYTLYLNRKPEVRAGLVLRKLPLDLTEPLPLALGPGESVQVPFRAAEPGTLRAVAEDGTALEVSVDGGPWHSSSELGRGEGTVSVRNGTNSTQPCSVQLEPRRLQQSVPLPPLPESVLGSMPAFPVLTAGAAQHLDLRRNGSATFVLRAEEPALYRLQTTGLLATEGVVRTRTVPSMFRAQTNGVGRNFLLQQYLRPGDYQLSVRALGATAGRIGVTLERTALRDGGRLAPGVPARSVLPPGEAVVYRFDVPEAGEWRLRSIGLGRTFRCRIEDADGWPVAAPDVLADQTLRFEKGSYRMILLPESVQTRRVTLFEKLEPAAAYSGHGPHELPLGRRVQNVWAEPVEGAERRPDVWELEVAAPARASIELSGGMQARLIQLGAEPRTVASLAPGRPWTGRLEAGRHRLEATCARINNHVRYELQVRIEELLAGQSIEVSAPASLPVSVGREGLIELSSFGTADVRARLYDESGRLLAESDDRPEDWNFQMLRRLPAGRYRLQLDPVGTASASCSVSMRQPQEIVEAALDLPARAEVVLGSEVRIYELKLPRREQLVLLSARSVETVGASLEVLRAGVWQEVAVDAGRTPLLAVPLDGSKGTRARLRLWSLDGQGAPVEIRAAAAAPVPVAEALLAGGVTLEAVAGFDPPLGIAAVELTRPGVLALDASGRELCLAAAWLEPCAEATDGLVAATGRRLWLVGALRDGGPSVRAVRRELDPGAGPAAPLAVRAGSVAVQDLAPRSPGPVLAIASSSVGQPGVRVTGRTEALAPSGTAMAAGPRSAASAALAPREAAALLWAAALPETGGPVDISLDVHAFSPPAAERTDWGVHEAELAGIVARRMDLPSGAARLRLTLGEATAAVLSDADVVHSVHWSGGRPFDETLQVPAGLAAPQLTLLHTREAADRARVELLPAAAAEAKLSAAEPLELRRPHAGTLRVRVAAHPSGAARLRARGSVEAATFVADTGEVVAGLDIELQGAGTLLLRHAPGMLFCWLESPEDAASGLWGSAAAPEPVSVTPPAALPLDGAAARALRLAAGRPMLFHVRAGTPSVTLLRRGKAGAEAAAHLAETRLDVLVTPGAPVELRLRALAGGTLSGLLELSSTELTPIGEGLGPQVLLPGGGTRLFSFEVSRAGPVGIGVRAESGNVECELLDAAGRRLGSGVVQMPVLQPGTYLLALRAPADSPPVRARPALAGLEPPGTGPPEEVIRRYVAPGAQGQDQADMDDSEESSEEGGDR
jgi:hypothetical protein